MSKVTDFVSPSGDIFRDVLTPDISKDGQIKLVVTGRENLQELYNSFIDSTDPGIVIQRFLDTGDPSLVSRSNPAFLDLLGAPKTLAEAYALNFRAENAFNGLPVEIRQKFGNNFVEFLNEVGSESWFDKLSMKNPNDLVIEKESDNSEK